MSEAVHALGLFSGGLDSVLAVRVLDRLGVAARAIYLRTGFGRPAHEANVGNGVEVHDVSERYLREVVLRPKHGFGSGMNPCIDCRVFMLREADRLARERGIGLLFTGEVVGQRGFDQSRAALQRTERLAGVEGRLLRPLCAGLMPPTDLERRGSVIRQGALRIHGSSRRAQLELARQLGVVDFPTPSGGCCRLSDRGFARRLRDLLAHRDGARVGPADISLLHRGRHFRLDWELKVVLGRDRSESVWLAEHAAGRATCQVASGRGTLLLVEGGLSEPRIPEVAALAARYSRERDRSRVEVSLIRGGERRLVTVSAASKEQLDRWRI